MSSKSAAFFDLDNTLIKGSSVFFLSRGMYQRGFFNKKEVASYVLANLRYRLTGKENPEEIDRFREAAQSFIKGHSVDEMMKVANDVYDKYVFRYACERGYIEIIRWLCSLYDNYQVEVINNKILTSGIIVSVFVVYTICIEYYKFKMTNTENIKIKKLECNTNYITSLNNLPRTLSYER